MKKLFYIPLLALLACGISSCDMEAPSQSSMDSSLIFSQYEMAEAAVMGIHQSFGETNSYRGRYLPYYGINSDVEWINGLEASGINDGGKNDLATYNAQPSNSQMNTDNNAYAKFYEGIERANKAIEGIRAYGNYENNPDMAHLLGEALTLRAVIYLDLIKGWGDVPARFSSITSETMYLPRADRDEIYKQLLADLLEAENYVYWPNESNITQTTERVSKAFVKALRARIALYAGGYSQRADGIRLSNDPDLDRTAMYTIVRDECLDVIAQYPNLASLPFKDNFTNLCRDVVTAGQESIWEIPFSEGRGRVLYTLGVEHQAKDQYTQQNKGGVNGPLPTLFYDYDVDDIRRNITCAPFRWSQTLTNGRSTQELASLKEWNFGKLRYEWMSRIVTSTNDDGVNWQYMRLADVYLMAAEAVNELEGPANAAQYMRPVLERALPSDKVSAYMNTATASKESFFDAIVEQRGLEFAGESLRKADLIRWNLLKTKLDEAKTKMKQLARREGKYADLIDKVYTYQTVVNEGEASEIVNAIPAGAYTSIETIDGMTDIFVIYGLNYGDTETVGETLLDQGYTSTTWLGTDKLEDAKVDVLYVNNPDENQYWPIWQIFVDNSNGMLTND
ncbi:RagB/SusD family nutrient uptake outer membrane protein [Bacteroides gallinaceum]|uniref:RagB/SusD family nutrient uptake outer membrane protein n=2 Tax=Bacteroidaceae TaxID=815 RepID=A0ABT7X916_9BACE|nr:MULTISPECIES: RagB/SusD family nutrient uptake outer membrane protein [Bacteroidaceae]HJD10486.1 RagB/SusD family nutrient uptake outer membrane protein [Candidatus Phocaeicola caecigallinarum]MBD8041282.1 RagB/SusD family nutrient uptake outer membrane protein [Phocaeicola intestinalis]MBM6658750.1 RagB/SusD family nutrient uptake outer membrane protein [Bacteroides gallinaceum]MBM6719591.1 RagB/SusD family nutrient uptake outer membrane protein [Bacteroides gallinaceum]MBM6946310.1 RagB/S